MSKTRFFWIYTILIDDIIEYNETMKISSNLTLAGWHL